MTRGIHPVHLPRSIRRDEATTAGYAPHADDRLPPAEHLRAGEGVDCLTAFAAAAERVRATFHESEAS